MGVHGMLSVVGGCTSRIVISVRGRKVRAGSISGWGLTGADDPGGLDRPGGSSKPDGLAGTSFGQLRAAREKKVSNGSLIQMDLM